MQYRILFKIKVEQKYHNLQEEVDDGRKVMKILRAKYKNAMAEIKDLTREHEIEKEDMLDTIRELVSELFT